MLMNLVQSARSQAQSCCYALSDFVFDDPVRDHLRLQLVLSTFLSFFFLETSMTVRLLSFKIACLLLVNYF
jgi:hypothetical protein